MAADGEEEILTCWHFTPASTWLGSVRGRGLEPYEIHNDGVREEMLQVSGSALAVWGWPNRPEGADLLGCVLDRVICHHATEIVALEISYRPHEEFRRRHGLAGYSFTHDGSIEHPRSRRGPWVYHRESPFVLLVDPIPPERIRLAAVIDLPAMIEVAFLASEKLRRRPADHG